MTLEGLPLSFLKSDSLYGREKVLLYPLEADPSLYGHLEASQFGLATHFAGLFAPLPGQAELTCDTSFIISSPPSLQRQNPQLCHRHCSVFVFTLAAVALSIDF